MTKPDWSALQKRFLSEYAKTGISPREWCKAQGLNYASARRYIKKPAAQKTAQSKVRNIARKQKSPTQEKSANAQIAQNNDKENLGILKPQHESFAQNIAQGMPQKEAAICAGYAPNNAESQASVMFKRPDIRRRIMIISKIFEKKPKDNYGKNLD
ncbi:hypothetical protein CE143_17585 [Photorhabdus luminescens]|uniref:Terminase small subunit n=1 Tax=Photorhabdus akhurstii TaxID=171438 RepID=A0ABX8LZ21_9GAMM|nr:hypothetical protein [Photorhabdus akhurstii]QXF34776.1 hypothetical protein B0X70_17575 [Photorhabdus akhurstii]UJD76603.1 hypothetical protein CE143_17585 [Photorhabdus luminescens]